LAAIKEQAEVMQSVEDLDPELLEQLIELGYIDADVRDGARADATGDR
jgi:hypothetical protein